MPRLEELLDGVWLLLKVSLVISRNRKGWSLPARQTDRATLRVDGPAWFVPDAGNPLDSGAEGNPGGVEIDPGGYPQLLAVACAPRSRMDPCWAIACNEATPATMGFPNSTGNLQGEVQEGGEGGREEGEEGEEGRQRLEVIAQSAEDPSSK